MIIPRPFLYIPKSPSKFYSSEVISLIEEKYNVVYVRDSELHTPTRGWVGKYVIFYQPKPDLSKGHSHYMAVTIQDRKVYITNGITATEPQVGIYYKHKFYYSTNGYDYVTTDDGECGIDGGRNMCRIIGDAKDTRTLCVSKDILYIK